MMMGVQKAEDDMQKFEFPFGSTWRNCWTCPQHTRSNHAYATRVRYINMKPGVYWDVCLRIHSTNSCCIVNIFTIECGLFPASQRTNDQELPRAPESRRSSSKQQPGDNPSKSTRRTLVHDARHAPTHPPSGLPSLFDTRRCSGSVTSPL